MRGFLNVRDFSFPEDIWHILPCAAMRGTDQELILRSVGKDSQHALLKGVRNTRIEMLPDLNVALTGKHRIYRKSLDVFGAQRLGINFGHI